jgi:hypothetical protein
MIITANSNRKRTSKYLLSARINTLCCEDLIQFTDVVASCFTNSVTRLICRDKKQFLVTDIRLPIRHKLSSPAGAAL